MTYVFEPSEIDAYNREMEARFERYMRRLVNEVLPDALHRLHRVVRAYPQTQELRDLVPYARRCPCNPRPFSEPGPLPINGREYHRRRRSR